MSELLRAADETAAVEQLHELGCTDGLPVVVPTPERVARMVLASGMDADLVLGEMGPGMGTATVEKVAVAAVMAGCLPSYFPVVLAATEAMDAIQRDGSILPWILLMVVVDLALAIAGVLTARPLQETQ